MDLVNDGGRLVPRALFELDNAKAKCVHCGDSGTLVDTIDSEQWPVTVPCHFCQEYCRICHKYRRRDHFCGALPIKGKE